MKHLMKGIRIAAYITEIIVAGSTIVEFVEKYSSKRKKKDAASKGANVNPPQVKLIQAM